MLKFIFFIVLFIFVRKLLIKIYNKKIKKVIKTS